jgi:signal transduction histidine kinase
MAVIGHLRRVTHARPHVADAAMAVVVWAVAVLTTSSPHHLRDGIALLLAGLACGALTLRRRWPYPSLSVSTVAAELFLARSTGDGGVLILAAPLIILYTVAESTGRRRSLVVAGLLVLILGAFHTFGAPAQWLGPENIALAALGGLAVAAGEASRSRRAYLAEVLLRAADAERDRQAQARRQVTEERLRIARELHDSVGHHLALINVQAGVARHVMTGSPAATVETLARIRDGSRAALEELRDTVGLLRQPGEPSAPTEPTVGLDSLGDLITAYERSGLQITVRRDGDQQPVPWPIGLTAYRIVQESLTNVCRHAGPTTARVVLRHDPAALTVIVENDGPPAAAPSPNAHGIIGMRERVTAVGGTLIARPRPGGGFRVAAILPTSAVPE